MLKRAIVITCAAIVFGATVATAAIPEPVKLDAGRVTGVPGALSDVRVFKGIPFAAPPIGDLRWKPPQPPAPWSGVKSADKFSANCMQRRAGGGAFPPYGGDRSATEMNEDCLYLNVYTASASAAAKRPVMVWIHGGAWTSGAGAIYEGEELARQGVVVVTINYRLGVFGFLAHPELTKESPNHASGNYAFLDQIAALRWVQKNIAAFGGDPGRVTIFGESAGSWSVNVLVASPLARGLFHRAIGESGGQFGVDRPLTAVEQAGARFAQTAAPTLVALRAMSADALQGLSGFDTTATIDGWVLPQSVRDTFAAGRQNDVPTIIGSNADEGSIFTNEDVTGASFRAQSQRRYGADADAFLALYPFSSDAEARRAQAASMRDSIFGVQMRTWARAQTQTGKSKVFLYYFRHVPPVENSTWIGAQHGAEIPYAFNWPSGKYTPDMKWTQTDRAVADKVSSLWVNFAMTGDPNGRDPMLWEPFDVATERAIEFGDTPVMKPVPHKAALDFLDRMATRPGAGTAR